MPLPKLAIPEYDLELPITGKKLSYRPFLVKEEKLLYLAMESNNDKEMIKAVKTIIPAPRNFPYSIPPGKKFTGAFSNNAPNKTSHING